ncbi:MAG: ABC transporter permease [Rickettsiales bacterium]|nr:MAG: ABC transporter permease [Rickettsiales bacterium]
MNQLQLIGAIEIGLIYSLVAIGVYITFKIIDFPDLTVDGSFTLGAAISSSMIFAGYDPYFSTLIAIFVGGISGLITGYLNVCWDILGLLAGILTMTALYSINLRIMGKPNIAIDATQSIFGDYSIILIFIFIVTFLIFILSRFFISELGLAIRAIGINPKVSSAYGINVGLMKIIALSLSNAIIALAGSLFAQSQGFADISMGTGTIIIGLASVIIGEAVIHSDKIWNGFITCAIGSIIYRIVIAFALNASEIGLEPSDLNLITATLVALTMISTKLRKKKIVRSV